MIFGPVPVAEAAGAILAHSVQAGALRLRKGVTLDAADCAALAGAGVARVTVARLEPGDLHEDAAAARIAAALVPDGGTQGLRLTPAATGRVNVHATGPGVARIDAAAVHALNRINPMITLATVAPFHRMDADGMVATVKIISYAVPGADVARACAALGAAGGPALALAPPVHATATLIETVVTPEPPSPKGRQALQGRLARFGVALSDRVLVPHDEAALAEALQAAPGELVFVLTGSATSDARDVGPQALRQAGGQVLQVGMPVDPGNLLFLGTLPGAQGAPARPVIGLPGCARSPALNGADWVMERVICGIPVGPGDIAAMGVGGLLKEIPTRPRPRSG